MKGIDRRRFALSEKEYTLPPTNMVYVVAMAERKEDGFSSGNPVVFHFHDCFSEGRIVGSWKIQG